MSARTDRWVVLAPPAGGGDGETGALAEALCAGADRVAACGPGAAAMSGAVERVEAAVGDEPTAADAPARSFLCYQWLKRREPAAVCFADGEGLALQALRARRQGLALAATTIVVAITAPLARRVALGEAALDSVAALAAAEQEREALALADAVIGADAAALAWCRRAGWALGPVRSPPGAAGGDGEPWWRAPVAAGAGPRAAADEALVSVCIAHHDRPAWLAEALASLEAQHDCHLEVIVVDDGSTAAGVDAALDTLAPRIEALGGRLLREPNRYLGAARNTAAAAARGDYLLFMDDDNRADPGEVATLVTAARNSGADVLTCVARLLEAGGDADGGPRVWVPRGPSAAVGVVVNGFGDANALFRRAAFDALGGFTEDAGVGHEDWELFARATLAGYRVELVPEALFTYRVAETGMLRAGHWRRDRERSLRPYRAAYPAIAPALELLAGLTEPARAPAAEAERLREQRDAARAAQRALEDELAGLRASRSWRWSAPLRWLRRWLQRAG